MLAFFNFLRSSSTSYLKKSLDFDVKIKKLGSNHRCREVVVETVVHENGHFQLAEVVLGRLGAAVFANVAGSRALVVLPEFARFDLLQVVEHGLAGRSGRRVTQNHRQQ